MLSGACSMYGRDENCNILVRKSEVDYFGVLCVDKKIILKQI
jgi:hypothetical protein